MADQNVDPWVFVCENRVSGYIGIVTLLEFVVSLFLSHFFTVGAQDITMILR